MRRPERSERRPEERPDLWRDTVWSLGLIGSVLLVVLVVAQFGHL